MRSHRGSTILWRELQAAQSSNPGPSVIAQMIPAIASRVVLAEHQAAETARLAIFLLRDKREFTEVVILERPLGIGRVVQRKCPRDMDFKRAGFDKAVELLERRRRVLAVVALDFYSGTVSGMGSTPLGLGRASALAQR